MTITSGIRLSEGNLFVNQRRLLSGVAENVVPASASGAAHSEGIFLGSMFVRPGSFHVVSLGTLRDVRFFASFRHKLWWMSQKMGTCGAEVPLETQFLILENPDEENGQETFYTVLLPLVEGSFRACLQGNARDELELCLESGDAAVQESSFTRSLFISAGTDPFKTITDAIKSVEAHMQTFRHREEKKMPSILDWFGWCTWDAFYTDVSAQGVEEGLKSLAEGGAPAKFVIIDDGWQSVGTEEAPKKQPIGRLIDIKENHKFHKNGKAGERPQDPAMGIQHMVSIAKEKHKVKYVYVWHAITGYWGGVKAGGEGHMDKYEPRVITPLHSAAVLNHEPGLSSDGMGTQGLGLVHPRQVLRFYSDLHSYLASSGIDGVKVDVQCILESLGQGYGGRVALTSAYHKALDSSVSRNFPDNGIIACMSHNTDALYCSKQTAVVRASDDFFPRDPVSHTIHIASVAYNSVFLGEFMQPDWDMFHSLHPAAEYHGAARAISGGPLYVSDKPGHHNFDVLKKLVLPDGSVLRACLPGRPTVDCLFDDPNRDGKSLLKIWNINKYTGVLGVFNCQGAAWSNIDKKNVFHDTNPSCLTGSVRAKDIHLLAEVAPDDWNGDCVVYSNSKGELVRVPKGASFPVTLQVLEKEIYTVTPVKSLGEEVSFAPVGLIDMFNAGGAIRELKYHVEDGHRKVEMSIHGCGRFGAYSSVKPRQCVVNNTQFAFNYDSNSGLLLLQLQIPKDGQLWNISVDLDLVS